MRNPLFCKFISPQCPVVLEREQLHYARNGTSEHAHADIPTLSAAEIAGLFPFDSPTPSCSDDVLLIVVYPVPYCMDLTL
jgi:hypothetical protein